MEVETIDFIIIIYFATFFCKVLILLWDSTLEIFIKVC